MTVEEVIATASSWLVQNALWVSLTATAVLAVSTGYLLWLNHQKNGIIISLMEKK